MAFESINIYTIYDRWVPCSSSIPDLLGQSVNCEEAVQRWHLDGHEGLCISTDELLPVDARVRGS